MRVEGASGGEQDLGLRLDFPYRLGRPDDDPLGPRVTPPFQGQTGGPDGGPILTLKGEDIDLLFLPRGAFPGRKPLIFISRDSLRAALSFALSSSASSSRTVSVRSYRPVSLTSVCTVAPGSSFVTVATEPAECGGMLDNEVIGVADGDRTRDLRVHNPAL